MYKVYKHTFPNQKVYIGITRLDVNRRWKNGKGYKGNIYLENAINKYGWENIKHEILFENLTKSEAESKEIELISLYQSTNRKYGYNILDGGNVSNGMSEEGKQRMIAKNKGKTPWNKGLKMNLTEEQRKSISNRFKGNSYRKGIPNSPETRIKLSLSHKGKPSNNKGKKMSEEQRRKLSESHKGKMINNVYVYCLETDTTYQSMTIAGKVLGLKPYEISRVCKGKRTHTHNYHFKYI